MIKVNKQEAWKIADEMFNTDYSFDSASSERAGYPIFRSTQEGHYNEYICDLGDRLEVNVAGKSTNIWIDDAPQVSDKMVHIVEIGNDAFVYTDFRRAVRFYEEKLLEGKKPGMMSEKVNEWTICGMNVTLRI